MEKCVKKKKKLSGVVTLEDLLLTARCVTPTTWLTVWLLLTSHRPRGGRRDTGSNERSRWRGRTIDGSKIRKEATQDVLIYFSLVL